MFIGLIIMQQLSKSEDCIFSWDLGSVGSSTSLLLCFLI